MRRLLVSLLSVLLVMAYAPTALAGEAALDPDFGSGGLVQSDLAEEATSMVVQPDGKIITFGSEWFYGWGPSFVLLRFTATGSLDPSFGDGGRVVTHIGYTSQPWRLLLQPDGRIVAVGTSSYPGGVLMARYLPDGSLDPSFGIGGTVSDTGVETSGGSPADAALLPDGRVVVLTSLFPSWTYVLRRYLVDGTVDVTFGTNGLVVGTPGWSGQLAIDGVGRIVVARTTPPGVGSSVTRYLGGGALDLSFGDDGTVTFDPQTLYAVGSLTTDSDDRIVIGGSDPSTPVLLRLVASGELDGSFGVDGVVHLSGLAPRDLAIHGRWLVAMGYVWPYSYGAARFASNGAIDTGFGNGGIVSAAFGPNNEYPYTEAYPQAGAVDSLGRIIVAGSTAVRGYHDVAIARFVVSNALPTGTHEGIEGVTHSACLAAGWAADPDNLYAPVTVRITSDGEPVTEVVADTFRQDLVDAGFGDGYHAFAVDIGPLISSDVPHLIRAQAQDLDTGQWSDIDWTPLTITCTEIFGTHEGSQGVATRAECRATGWAADLDTQTGPRVQVRIKVDGRVVAETTANRFRQDVLDAGFGDGYSGFNVNLYGKVEPNRAHDVTVEARDTTAKKIWVPLDWTPLQLTCNSH
jgi:uncharacterized delta-60 repeat protein